MKSFSNWIVKWFRILFFSLEFRWIWLFLFLCIQLIVATTELVTIITNITPFSLHRSDFYLWQGVLLSSFLVLIPCFGYYKRLKVFQSNRYEHYLGEKTHILPSFLLYLLEQSYFKGSDAMRERKVIHEALISSNTGKHHNQGSRFHKVLSPSELDWVLHLVDYSRFNNIKTAILQGLGNNMSIALAIPGILLTLTTTVLPFFITNMIPEGRNQMDSSLTGEALWGFWGLTVSILAMALWGLIIPILVLYLRKYVRSLTPNEYAAMAADSLDDSKLMIFIHFKIFRLASNFLHRIDIGVNKHGQFALNPDGAGYAAPGLERLSPPSGLTPPFDAPYYNKTDAVLEHVTLLSVERVRESVQIEALIRLFSERLDIQYEDACEYIFQFSPILFKDWNVKLRQNIDSILSLEENTSDKKLIETPIRRMLLENDRFVSRLQKIKRYQLQGISLEQLHNEVLELAASRSSSDSLRVYLRALVRIAGRSIRQTQQDKEICTDSIAHQLIARLAYLFYKSRANVGSNVHYSLVRLPVSRNSYIQDSGPFPSLSGLLIDPFKPDLYQRILEENQNGFIILPNNIITPGFVQYHKNKATLEGHISIPWSQSNLGLKRAEIQNLLLPFADEKYKELFKCKWFLGYQNKMLLELSLKMLSHTTKARDTLVANASDHILEKLKNLNNQRQSVTTGDSDKEPLQVVLLTYGFSKAVRNTIRAIRARSRNEALDYLEMTYVIMNSDHDNEDAIRFKYTLSELKADYPKDDWNDLLIASPDMVKGLLKNNSAFFVLSGADAYDEERFTRICIGKQAILEVLNSLKSDCNKHWFYVLGESYKRMRDLSGREARIDDHYRSVELYRINEIQKLINLVVVDEKTQPIHLLAKNSKSNRPQEPTTSGNGNTFRRWY